MLEHIGIYLNVLITISQGLPIRHLPLRNRLRLPLWGIVLIYLGILVLSIPLFSVLEHLLPFLPVGSGFKAMMGMIYGVLPFLWIRASFFQNLFLLMVSANYILVIMGTGNYAAKMYGGAFAAQYPDLVSSAFSVLLAIPCLPLTLHFLKRLFSQYGATQTTALWKLAWMIPSLFFLLCLASGSIFTRVSPFELYFLVIRFLVAIGMVAVCFLFFKAIMETQERAALMERFRMTERQLDLQRVQYETLAERVETAKKAQHDMRHHMILMKQYASERAFDRLCGYIDGLIELLPGRGSERLFCSNHAANAIASYYADLSDADGIALNAQTDIPEDIGQISTPDLCVILGNLLENALEACRRQTQDPRLIRMRAELQDRYFTLVVENSFDGVYKETDGVFYSLKREGIGIGLSSVSAIAAKYDGSACSTVLQGNFFQTAVVLKAFSCQAEAKLEAPSFYQHSQKDTQKQVIGK